MNEPLYRLVGWARRGDIDLGSCCFSIELDANFAQKARGLKFTYEQQGKFEEMIRKMVGYISMLVLS